MLEANKISELIVSLGVIQYYYLNSCCSEQRYRFLLILCFKISV